MAVFDVEAVRAGFRVVHGGLIIEVDHHYRDKNVIRGSLTISNGTQILHRDTVNLTSSRSRQKLIKELHGKKIELDERVLVALEGACKKPRGSTKPPESTDTPVKGPPLDLAGLEAAFSKRLLIEDHDYLPILVGTVLSQKIESDPVWLMIVAPPGATKSEVLRTLYGYPGIYPLSDLTNKTFASGLSEAGRDDPSLLARLSNEILVLKDFTTVLEMQRDARREILAQLREIYDGRYDKSWGTGKELHWEGRLGFLAGVTPVIDGHHSVMALLGARFLLFRVETPDRHEMAEAALLGVGDEQAMRDELKAAMHGFLAARAAKPPEVSPETRHTLASVADLITRGRSGVVREGYKRDLEYAPEAEAPTRFAKALLSLACGITMAYDQPAVGGQALRLVLRVALDCLPAIRRRVMAALVREAITTDSEGTLSTSEIAGSAQFSTTAIRRALEDLQALGVVTCQKAGQGRADLWELLPEARAVFEDLDSAVGCHDRPPNFSGKVGSVPEELGEQSWPHGVAGGAGGDEATSTVGAARPDDPAHRRSTGKRAILVDDPDDEETV